MKYLSFIRPDGSHAFGRFEGNTVYDLTSNANTSSNLKAAIHNKVLNNLENGKAYLYSDLRLLPVIPSPSKIFCIGLNYETHRQETGRAKAEHPAIFTRFADSLNAHGQAILRPKISTDLDYEGELAIIIGKGGRNISETDANDHIAGYTCFNDASIRDWQWHTHQFTPGKNFPSTGPIGPYMVTPDEAGELSDVHVVTRLNGEVVQDQAIGEMIFSVPKIIAYLSTFTPLNPGDVIATGTPGGVGAKRKPPLWMKAGDKITVEIGPLGVLENTIADE